MDAREFEPVSGRLFLCLELPDYVREALLRLREGYPKADGLSWVDSGKLHITLAFLGEVEPERQEELAKRLPEVQVQPFFLALEGLGVFPQKGRPQVLWAGLANADPRLFQLHGKLERVTMDLGFEPERRRYRPHVTLARCQPRAQPVVGQILKKESGFGTAPFQVNGFALYASQLTSKGSVYTRLLEVPFLPADPSGPAASGG